MSQAEIPSAALTAKNWNSKLHSKVCCYLGFSERLWCCQLHRHFRKPLIVFAPKNLLRHPQCKSFLWEFDDIPDDDGIMGVRFKRIIMDDGGIIPKSRAPNPPQEEHINRVVFCAGKVYYELHATRKELERDNVAIIRIEQVCTPSLLCCLCWILVPCMIQL